MNNDMTQAANIVAQAVATDVARETLLGEIAEYVETNPYKVYADYRDCISDEYIDDTITANEYEFTESGDIA